MARPLPPLNALRAFTAAARHLSFTRAAAELHVTQAAVSHQVKALEARLGTKLFRRLTRGLLLTDEGQALLPGLSDGFERLAAAVERVGAKGGGGTLTVSLLTTFAVNWLVARLPRFQASHPAIEVRLTTTSRLVDFAREDVDVAIRLGAGNWPGLTAHKLLDEELSPLCAPTLARRLKTPADLARLTLLQDSSESDDWLTWFDAAGQRVPNATQGPGFDSTHIAVQAAIKGLGVAIGMPSMFAADLESGRLVQPFELVVKNGKANWLVYPEASALRPKIAHFRDWIVAEARAA